MKGTKKHKPSDRGANTRASFYNLARTVAESVDLVPDVQHFLEGSDQAKLIALYAKGLTDEAQAKLKHHHDRGQQDFSAIQEALPEELEKALIAYCDTESTVAWLREEVAYAIGIEIGRRMGGAR